MLSRISIWILAMLFLCTSCQEENCQKTQRNSILSQNMYNSKAYQAELYRLIKESEGVDYYYEMREEIFGQSYLVVNAYGDAFCGKLCLVISEEDASRIEVDKSKGYQGAQLIGLKYKNTKNTSGLSNLVYDSMEYIVN